MDSQKLFEAPKLLGKTRENWPNSLAPFFKPVHDSESRCRSLRAHVDALILALLEPFQVEHQVLVMIDMESADRKESSFLLHDQEVKNSGHELSRVVKSEENYHMVAEKRSLRW